MTLLIWSCLFSHSQMRIKLFIPVFFFEKTCSVTSRCAFENIFQDGGHVTLPLFTPEIYVSAHTSQGAAFCLLERCLNFLFVYISFTQCITSLNNPVVMTCPYTLLGLLICYCWAFGDPAWVPCGVVYKLAHACRWPLFERWPRGPPSFNLSVLLLSFICQFKFRFQYFSGVFYPAVMSL